MTANVSIIVAQRPGVLRVTNNALRVRLPDVPPPAPSKDGSAKPALRAPTDEERRELFRDAGFSPGSGPPSEEVRAKLRQLAAERGFELPNRGGGNRPHSPSEGPVTRVLYRLEGQGPAAHPVAVNV
jgi:HlyD family secretion protein